jgi:hypothetical protein
MPKMNYLDFDLFIERSRGAYIARVLHASTGETTESFKLPFSKLELDKFLLKIGRPQRGMRRLNSPAMQAAKTFGGRLFKAVFKDEIRACLKSSIDQAEANGNGLRIRLRLNVPRLLDLPWEYLYNPSLNRFLALSIATPVVRYIELPERIQPLVVKPPVKILSENLSWD